MRSARIVKFESLSIGQEVAGASGVTRAPGTGMYSRAAAAQACEPGDAGIVNAM